MSSVGLDDTEELLLLLYCPDDNSTAVGDRNVVVDSGKGFCGDAIVVASMVSIGPSMGCWYCICNYK
jgi:hypothetical protein